MVLAFVVVAGCARRDESAAGDEGGVGVSGSVLVLAASSLTEPFQAIEAAFEESHPGVDVVVSTGASSALREQLLQGAPVDVFASADVGIMEEVEEAGLVNADSVLPLAANSMVIGVGQRSVGEVVSIEDFGREELLIGLCAKGVPCGDLGRAVLDRAGVVAAVDSDEPNVRALVAKIVEGELDAGLIYASDGFGEEAIHTVAIDESINVETIYPIGVLDQAPNRSGAEAFVEFARSPHGQDLLVQYGFMKP